MVAALCLLVQNCCLSAGGGAAGNPEMAPLIGGLRAGTLVLWVVPAALVIAIGWRFRRLLRTGEPIATATPTMERDSGVA